MNKTPLDYIQFFNTSIVYNMSNWLQIMNTEDKFEMIPATEENLALENDIHPFDENPPNNLSERHAVLVDEIKGVACVGSLGGYSTRINISLEEEHPELGKDFQTKYFMFTEPGSVIWGHNGQSFKILKIVKN